MDYQILAGMPHMHEIGSAFRHEITRVDGSQETLIALNGWSFELQYFYDMNTMIKAGDVLDLTCTFDNYKDYWVSAGGGTTDEMCFNFMYVTPPAAGGECVPF